MSKPLGGPFEVLWYHVTNVFSNAISYNDIKSFLILIIEKMLILELEAHYRCIIRLVSASAVNINLS